MESRHAEGRDGEVEKSVEGQDDEGHLEVLLRELNMGLRGVKRTLEERRVQWVDQLERTMPCTVERCVQRVRAAQMTVMDVRNE
jgi:hypothetical protein